MESPPQVRKIMDQIHGRVSDAMRRARREASSDSCYVPQHDEDSHFCHDAFGVVAVADGVGGRRAQGVDAAAFSRGLMENTFSEVATSELGKPVCPYKILERVYRRTAALGTPMASTSIIVSLAGMDKVLRVLRWAYVGDSGFAVFRGGKMLRRFQPQQWYFNCPFQLCVGNGITKVSDAALGQMAIEEGDVLVVASDGLFDNVSDFSLENLVRSTMLLGFTPEEVAGIMSFQAYVASKDPKTDSPFSIASREQGQARTGGKVDDITIVVAFIEIWIGQSQQLLQTWLL
ncbi:hypothetical protein QYE76_034574 [Lolium multiflorum]|uniref:Protein phosphatase n=1 Tax=Lolium multiflorum TaxID=4521 RepID=A0AAD8QZ71_LOLMU|nr:hypothetical protein QYE76_034574 [Lolium multiflorum]